MDASFWHDRWNSNQIGFHQDRTNPQLTAHFEALSLNTGDRVFVPLCGKTRDIRWLLDHGLRVAGAELSEIAVKQLFDAMAMTPDVTASGAVRVYSGPGVEIFTGDIFDLSPDMLGTVEAVYDRAALVALPDNMRAQYARHLVDLTRGARQLLICLEYDQSVMDGPPFSVPAAEVRRLYGDVYDMAELATVPVEGGLKGICPADSTAWLLT